MKSKKYPYYVVLVLTLLMIVTRGSHFSGISSLPEASWMIFMVAGLLFPIFSFIWFMSLAVAIDTYAFTFGGISGTCFSIAYGMLIPAYFSMWTAGRIAKAYVTGSILGYIAFFGLALCGTFVCELISSGSFYLWSGNFEPTLMEFFAREQIYAPAMFATSAFWATAFVAMNTICRIYIKSRQAEVLTP